MVVAISLELVQESLCEGSAGAGGYQCPEIVPHNRTFILAITIVGCMHLQATKTLMIFIHWRRPLRGTLKT
jgi:hypothetical protein